MTITAAITYSTIKIHIDELLHLYIQREQLMGFQSWIEREGKYMIEFTLSKGVLLCEYDKRHVWEEIIRLLDKLP